MKRLYLRNTLTPQRQEEKKVVFRKPDNLAKLLVNTEIMKQK